MKTCTLHWLVVGVLAALAVALWYSSSRLESFRNSGRAWGTYHNYDERGNGDGSTIDHTACAPNAGVNYVPSSLLKKHNWIAINPPTFGLSNDGDRFRRETCGTCVEVRRKNGKKNKFLVVDIKGEVGVDMSQHGFKKLGMRDNEFVSVTRTKC